MGFPMGKTQSQKAWLNEDPRLLGRAQQPTLQLRHALGTQGPLQLHEAYFSQM
jgi:hypothetical protein